MNLYHCDIVAYLSLSLHSYSSQGLSVEYSYLGISLTGIVKCQLRTQIFHLKCKYTLNVTCTSKLKCNIHFSINV